MSVCVLECVRRNENPHPIAVDTDLGLICDKDKEYTIALSIATLWECVGGYSERLRVDSARLIAPLDTMTNLKRVKELSKLESFCTRPEKHVVLDENLFRPRHSSNLKTKQQSFPEHTLLVQSDNPVRSSAPTPGLCDMSARTLYFEHNDGRER